MNTADVDALIKGLENQLRMTTKASRLLGAIQIPSCFPCAPTLLRPVCC